MQVAKDKVNKSILCYNGCFKNKDYYEKGICNNACCLNNEEFASLKSNNIIAIICNSKNISSTQKNSKCNNNSNSNDDTNIYRNQIDGNKCKQMLKFQSKNDTQCQKPKKAQLCGDAGNHDNKDEQHNNKRNEKDVANHREEVIFNEEIKDNFDKKYLSCDSQLLSPQQRMCNGSTSFLNDNPTFSSYDEISESSQLLFSTSVGSNLYESTNFDFAAKDDFFSVINNEAHSPFVMGTCMHKNNTNDDNHNFFFSADSLRSQSSSNFDCNNNTEDSSETINDYYYSTFAFNPYEINNDSANSLTSRFGITGNNFYDLNDSTEVDIHSLTSSSRHNHTEKNKSESFMSPVNNDPCFFSFNETSSNFDELNSHAYYSTCFSSSCQNSMGDSTKALLELNLYERNNRNNDDSENKNITDDSSNYAEINMNYFSSFFDIENQNQNKKSCLFNNLNSANNINDSENNLNSNASKQKHSASTINSLTFNSHDAECKCTSKKANPNFMSNFFSSGNNKNHCPNNDQEDFYEPNCSTKQRMSSSYNNCYNFKNINKKNSGVNDELEKSPEPTTSSIFSAVTNCSSTCSCSSSFFSLSSNSFLFNNSPFSLSSSSSPAVASTASIFSSCCSSLPSFCELSLGDKATIAINKNAVSKIAENYFYSDSNDTTSSSCAFSFSSLCFSHSFLSSPLLRNNNDKNGVTDIKGPILEDFDTLAKSTIISNNATNKPKKEEKIKLEVEGKERKKQIELEEQQKNIACLNISKNASSYDEKRLHAFTLLSAPSSSFCSCNTNEVSIFHKKKEIDFIKNKLNKQTNYFNNSNNKNVTNELNYDSGSATISNFLIDHFLSKSSSEDIKNKSIKIINYLTSEESEHFCNKNVSNKMTSFTENTFDFSSMLSHTSNNSFLGENYCIKAQEKEVKVTGKMEDINYINLSSLFLDTKNLLDSFLKIYSKHNFDHIENSSCVYNYNSNELISSNSAINISNSYCGSSGSLFSPSVSSCKLHTLVNILKGKTEAEKHFVKNTSNAHLITSSVKNSENKNNNLCIQKIVKKNCDLLNSNENSNKTKALKDNIYSRDHDDSFFSNFLNNAESSKNLVFSSLNDNKTDSIFFPENSTNIQLNNEEIGVFNENYIYEKINSSLTSPSSISSFGQEFNSDMDYFGGNFDNSFFLRKKCYDLDEKIVNKIGETKEEEKKKNEVEQTKGEKNENDDKLIWTSSIINYAEKNCTDKSCGDITYGEDSNSKVTIYNNSYNLFNNDKHYFDGTKEKIKNLAEKLGEQEEGKLIKLKENMEGKSKERKTSKRSCIIGGIGKENEILKISNRKIGKKSETEEEKKGAEYLLFRHAKCSNSTENSNFHAKLCQKQSSENLVATNNCKQNNHNDVTNNKINNPSLDEREVSNNNMNDLLHEDVSDRNKCAEIGHHSNSSNFNDDSNNNNFGNNKSYDFTFCHNNLQNLPFSEDNLKSDIDHVHRNNFNMKEVEPSFYSSSFLDTSCFSLLNCFSSDSQTISSTISKQTPQQLSSIYTSRINSSLDNISSSSSNVNTSSFCSPLSKYSIMQEKLVNQNAIDTATPISISLPSSLQTEEINKIDYLSTMLELHPMQVIILLKSQDLNKSLIREFKKTGNEDFFDNCVEVLKVALALLGYPVSTPYAKYAQFFINNYNNNKQQNVSNNQSTPDNGHNFPEHKNDSLNNYDLTLDDDSTRLLHSPKNSNDNNLLNSIFSSTSSFSLCTFSSSCKINNNSVKMQSFNATNSKNFATPTSPKIVQRSFINLPKNCLNNSNNKPIHLSHGIGGPNFSAPAVLAHPDEFKNPSSFLKIYGDPMCANGMGAKTPLKGLNGNWICPRCDCVNFPRRFRCNKCETYRDVKGNDIVLEYARRVYQQHLKTYRAVGAKAKPFHPNDVPPLSTHSSNRFFERDRERMKRNVAFDSSRLMRDDSFEAGFSDDFNGDKKHRNKDVLEIAEGQSKGVILRNIITGDGSKVKNAV